MLDGDAHFVKGPFWSYPGKDGNDPDWGLVTGGGGGDSSLGWSSPGKTGDFQVRVNGQISCGDGGEGDPIDFSAGWDGDVVATQLELTSVTFAGGNHSLKADNRTYVSDGTGDVRTPEILKQDGTGIGTDPFISPEYEEPSPICYTWQTSPSLNAVFNTTDTGDANAKVKVSGTIGNSTLTYGEKSIPLDGSSHSVTFSTNDQLAKAIANGNFTLNWQTSLDDGASWEQLTTTSNEVFVVAGEPISSGITVTRLKFATLMAAGSNTSAGIGDKVGPRSSDFI